jgi:hypothetical protein
MTLAMRSRVPTITHCDSTNEQRLLLNGGSILPLVKGNHFGGELGKTVVKVASLGFDDEEIVEAIN